jgi:hypothetical protein
MSYDIYLVDPVSKETLCSESVHTMAGSTYVVGGTNELSLSITYNYSKHFYRVFGEGGIRSIYGKTGAESLPLFKAAIELLGNDTNPDYWASTEGNAKRALYQLHSKAQMRPDGVWEGD